MGKKVHDEQEEEQVEEEEDGGDDGEQCWLGRSLH
jgi:hypothetical protein